MAEDLHETAREFMRKHSKRGWRTLSLDEWLAQYGANLPPEVTAEGYEILSGFSGYGGNA